jgi:hypothetical protein
MRKNEFLVQVDSLCRHALAEQDVALEEIREVAQEAVRLSKDENVEPALILGLASRYAFLAPLLLSIGRDQEESEATTVIFTIRKDISSFSN